jgi:hypothetical protein
VVNIQRAMKYKILCEKGMSIQITMRLDFQTQKSDCPKESGFQKEKKRTRKIISVEDVEIYHILGRS